MIFHHRTAEGEHIAKVSQPDRWLSVEEAAALLEADLDELLGRTPPHPRATVLPSATADLSPSGSRTGDFAFTPGLRGDAA